MDAVFKGLAGDDVHDTTHCVASVEHRSRTAEHFHALGHQGLVRVCDRMAEDALILGMSVDEHHHLS